MATTKKDITEYSDNELILLFNSTPHLNQILVNAVNKRSFNLIQLTLGELYSYTNEQEMNLHDYFYSLLNIQENISNENYHLQHKHLS